MLTRSVVLGLTLLAVGTCCGVVLAAEEVPVPTGSISGRVVDAGSGEAVSGATVAVLQREQLSGADGEFRFDDLPLERATHLNLRIVDAGDHQIGCATISVPVKFYPVAASSGEGLAVAIAAPGDGAEVTLKLEQVPAERVDAYCAECHKNNPCLQLTRYGEGERKGKLGGIAVREGEVEALQQKLERQGFEKKAFRGLRYQDAHPQGIDMSTALADPDSSRFQPPSDLQLLEGKTITCDTCHTRHVPGADTPYAVLEFQEENTLCYQCHL